RTGRVQHLVLITGAIARILPQHYQWHSPASERICFYYLKNRILGLGPGNQEIVFLWHQPIVVNQVNQSRRYEIGPVRNHSDLSGGGVSKQVFADLWIICD